MANTAILKSVVVKLSEIVAEVRNNTAALAGRIKGLGLAPKAGDKFVVSAGTEPELTTVSGSAPLVNKAGELQYAPGAYWRIEGMLVSADGSILDEHYQLPLAVLYRSGKEFPCLGEEYAPANGAAQENRSGRRLLGDLLAQYPDSVRLYRQEDELEKARLLNAAEAGYAISFEEEVEIFVLPPRTKAFRDALGRRWGSLAEDWRRSSAYGVEIRRDVEGTTPPQTRSRKKSK